MFPILPDFFLTFFLTSYFFWYIVPSISHQNNVITIKNRGFSMNDAQGKKWGKVVFLVTFIFCSWVIWYISAPPPGASH